MMESVWNISTKMHDPGVDQRGGGEEEQQGEVVSAELHPGWGLTGGGARRHQLIYSPSPLHLQSLYYTHIPRPHHSSELSICSSQKFNMERQNKVENSQL